MGEWVVVVGGDGGGIISRSNVTWVHKNNTNPGVDNNLDIYQLHFLFVCLHY